jgi:hypothetical protein
MQYIYIGYSVHIIHSLKQHLKFCSSEFHYMQHSVFLLYAIIDSYFGDAVL